MRYIILLIMAIALSSCASRNKMQITEIPEPLEEIHNSEQQRHTAGSLWSEENTSLFADHKAHQIGDIVTVTISEESSATKEATTTTDRSSSWNAGIPNFFGLENADFFVDRNDHVDLSNLISADFSNSFDGSGRTVRSDNLSASLTTQVIGKYDNGNLKIRGGKEVTVNSEIQVIYITGIIRPEDITAQNTVDSAKILNARITYTGKGVISDKQESGWLGRAMDYIWPF